MAAAMDKTKTLSAVVSAMVVVVAVVAVAVVVELVMPVVRISMMTMMMICVKTVTTRTTTMAAMMFVRMELTVVAETRAMVMVESATPETVMVAVMVAVAVVMRVTLQTSALVQKLQFSGSIGSLRTRSMRTRCQAACQAAHYVVMSHQHSAIRRHERQAEAVAATLLMVTWQAV
jgi:hypothetical protein